MRPILFIALLGFALTSIGQSIPSKPNDISPLLVGESIPTSDLTNIDGKSTAVSGIFREKPTVLVVYRGGWCPYCNIHLAELQDIEDEILKLGYQIVAVSPDAAENLKASTQKHSLKYKLYSDSNMQFSQDLGIAYKAPERNLNMLASASGGDNPGMLPVPSVFLVDQKGTILFEYINPNYKVRVTGELLLAALRSL